MNIKACHSVLILFFLFLGSCPLIGQEATFIPNKGQWEGDFEYKTSLSSGAAFFDKNGFYTLLIPGEGHHHHSHEGSGKPVAEKQQAVNIRMDWVNGQTEKLIPTKRSSYYCNYILGKNPTRWKTKVSVFEELIYQNIYPGVDVKYYSTEGLFKYDLYLASGVPASTIKMKYSGIKSIEVKRNRLNIITELGSIEEWIPEAYQEIGDQKKKVNCYYIVEGNTVSFKLGKHDTNHPVVIDPILVFSSFSGSIANNFGFTATYDNHGNFYGGGAALNVGFQGTPGVVQIPFGGGPMDVTINKFSSDGTSLLYATHLGGGRSDAPHSLNITPQNELLILGNTDSDNFPTTTGAFQTNFVQGPNFSNSATFPYYNKGSNIFVAKLSSDGTNLISSSLLGDSGGDGINMKIYRNYGDRFRGDILALSNGNIAFTSSSLSKNLPLSTNGINTTGSDQNAIVVVMNSSLSQIVWGSYFGGDVHESGYSVKSDGTYLYVAGATNSASIPASTGGLNSSNIGKLDGYIAKFQISNGALIQSTYLGGAEDDQAFFLDIDKDNNIYIHGQTESTIPVSSNTYGTSGAQQFIQKLNNNLTTLQWSTNVGTGTKSDWVPTAFMVDRCYNIYMSGWNGGSNTSVATGGFSSNNTNGLPTSPDAFQNTTDGSDFYFMILTKDAQSFLFGSYFGGTSEEHVDGGTSRFSPDGVIYQAVCAGCFGGTFPTTPNSYSPTKPNNDCNLGAIKIDFQQTVRANATIDPVMGIDTICDTLFVNFSNTSIHANKFHWDFGNGQTSNLYQPSVKYTAFGSYTITLVAEDTVCDLSDTSSIVINHQQGATVIADFEASYAGCNNNYEANFKNYSSNTDTYEWDFGDGSTSNLQEPTHSFPDTGTYKVQLISISSDCNRRDTLTKIVTFSDTVITPNVFTSYPDCSDGKIEVTIENNRKRYNYRWIYNGKGFSGAYPEIRFQQRGLHKVMLTIEDTLCNATHDFAFDLNVQAINKSTFIPNSFTPDGDGINDQFEIFGESCKGSDYMRIYNRWGQLIFETNSPFDTFWDGTYKGKPVPQGVYTFSLKTGEEVTKNTVLLIR
ncbi:PKD domain-containing protein [Owenweeksia hongkongensis]|uniref:DUF7948 domain-containing protein n=1 Tax=Owenweeksia hongkongensis TaxID=253245 RepID=UPI003A8D271C